MRLALLPILALAACSSVVPATVLKLGGLSPTTADPAGFAVDLDLPDGIGVQPGTVVLAFAVRRTDTGESNEASYALTVREGVYRIAEEDLPALRAQQATARAWQETAPEATKGALSVMLAPCTTGTGPAPGATVDVAIQITEGGALLPLLQNAPLSAVASAAEIDQMPACP